MNLLQDHLCLLVDGRLQPVAGIQIFRVAGSHACEQLCIGIFRRGEILGFEMAVSEQDQNAATLPGVGGRLPARGLFGGGNGFRMTILFKQIVCRVQLHWQRTLVGRPGFGKVQAGFGFAVEPQICQLRILFQLVHLAGHQDGGIAGFGSVGRGMPGLFGEAPGNPRIRIEGARVFTGIVEALCHQEGKRWFFVIAGKRLDKFPVQPCGSEECGA